MTSVETVIALLRARGFMGVIIARQLLMAKGLDRTVVRKGVARTIEKLHPRQETLTTRSTPSTGLAPRNGQQAATDGVRQP